MFIFWIDQWEKMYSTAPTSCETIRHDITFLYAHWSIQNSNVEKWTSNLKSTVVGPYYVACSGICSRCFPRSWLCSQLSTMLHCRIRRKTNICYIYVTILTETDKIIHCTPSLVHLAMTTYPSRYIASYSTVSHVISLWFQHSLVLAIIHGLSAGRYVWKSFDILRNIWTDQWRNVIKIVMK